MARHRAGRRVPKHRAEQAPWPVRALIRFAGLVTAVVLVVVEATSCQTVETVTDRWCDRGRTQTCHLEVKQGGVHRQIQVSREAWAACEIGEVWPGCALDPEVTR